jgi:O-antigen ligase
MVLAPLTFGSQDPFWHLLHLVLLGCGALLLLTFPLRRAELGILALFLLTVVVLGWVLLAQMGRFGLAPHRYWAETAALLGEPLPGRPAISARWPTLELLLAALPPTAFLCGMALSRLPWRTSRILTGAVIVGTAVAALWSGMFLLSPDTILWREKLGHQTSLTGTFTNRNTAAAFLGLMIVITTLQLCDQIDTLFLSRRMRLRDAWDFVTLRWPRALIGHAAALLILWPACLMTVSRAGVALALLGSVLVIALRLRRHLRRVRITLSALVVGLVVLVALAELFGQQLKQRMVDSQDVDIDRFEAYAAAIAIIRDHPWLGSGFGSFADVFSAYRPETMPVRGIWTLAHNTYLQIAVEAGLPGLAAVLIPVAAVAGVFVRGALRSPPGHLAPIAGLGILIMPTLHALVDFPVQIPGYVIPLCGLLGCLFARTVAARPDPRGIHDVPKQQV